MAEAPLVLIVDDDREIRELLSRFLSQHGFRVETVADGAGLWLALNRYPIDLIVLDLMLPGEDGLILCQKLRATSTLPIVMLTAIAEDVDRIVGLELGADDYVTKPFNPRELLARIKAVLRRGEYGAIAAQAKPKGFTFQGWRLDVARRELYSPEDVLTPLTASEFDLLVAFAEHPQQVLSRDQLLGLTKGHEAAPFDRSIDVQLSRLRRKIEPSPKEPVLIKTVRGGGYLFTPSVEKR
jgi:two-component system, OmpR family, response regulator